MPAIATRLRKLEDQARPRRVYITIQRPDGLFEVDGELLTEDQIGARAADDDIYVFIVKWDGLPIDRAAG